MVGYELVFDYNAQHAVKKYTTKKGDYKKVVVLVLIVVVFLGWGGVQPGLIKLWTKFHG